MLCSALTDRECSMEHVASLLLFPRTRGPANRRLPTRPPLLTMNNNKNTSSESSCRSSATAGDDDEGFLSRPRVKHAVNMLDPQVVGEIRARLGSRASVKNVQPSKLKDSIWPMTPKAPPSSPAGELDNMGKTGENGMSLSPSEVLKETAKRLLHDVSHNYRELLI